MKKQPHISLLLLAFFLMLTVLTPNKILAQDEGEDISIGKRFTFHSKLLNEDRPIDVYLPTRYNLSDDRYPVMILLDGNTHFHYGSGIVEFLSRNDRMPQSIVVGIPNTNRNRDFTPTQIPERPETGGADNFIRFLKEELLPYLDSHYRTVPYRILTGHSLTGLFTAYTMAHSPEVFNAYIAVSPWFIYDNSQFIKYAGKELKNKDLAKERIYITLGGDEEQNVLESIQIFTAMLQQVDSPGFDWKFEVYENQDHGTVVLKSIYDALVFLFQDWHLPQQAAVQGLDFIKDHYQKLSEKYGYKITPPEAKLNILGYQAMQRGMTDEAIRIFKENVKLHPESPNVYDSLGEGYEAAGNLELARTNYLLAVKKGEKNNDPNLVLYKQHLEKINKQLSDKI